VANERMTNEAAMAVARRCLAVVRGLLRDEEAGDCFREFHDIAKQEVQKFAAEAERHRRRMNPTEAGPWTSP
jgi:hypothetical protein